MTLPDPLTPLATLVRRHPDVEAQVLWASGDTWEAQDDQDEMMDGEEIPYYAEGLLMEGFGMAWLALGEGAQAEVLLLMVWEPGVTPPPAPLPEEGWQVLAQGRIEAA
ncbi:hypothetical protein NX862_00660 [Rhodobacter sp. KR11]|uniref:hypothetical protein n=1 Tax=Rhodobacter sp. KR11 TaxID=2974588 RepID=UPI002221810A|nr:hypothetical protein [Rhodobacter sp. KR11]MCW1917257.1 hypothetical protein [Rhodobacter sp. KR11]